MGDPLGVGPEVIKKALFGYSPHCAIVILGDITYYPDKSVTLISGIEHALDSHIYFLNVPVPETSELDPSFEFVSRAIDLALAKKVAALVTGPISKEKWQRAGVPFNGHTGLLAKTAGVTDYSMFFWSEELKVALFTQHIPLSQIFRYLERSNVIEFIRLVDRELFRLFKKRFTFLVSGLNPHAGEDGFMGTEEQEVIHPAIEALKPEMEIHGPYPPDTIFIKARETKDSVVISWYHDQGLIAFKLLNLHSGVNMTLGLPYIRTSPDHGTAFDIAGQDIANPSSMKQAIRLAETLVKNKKNKE